MIMKIANKAKKIWLFQWVISDNAYLKKHLSQITPFIKKKYLLSNLRYRKNARYSYFIQ